MSERSKPKARRKVIRREIIKPAFFRRATLEVALELIGLYLVHREGEAETAHAITEVEAYLGPEDLASHARFGSSRRNAVMFGPGGHWYVYLIYGIYNMLNIVTGAHGEPGAILFRGLAGLPGPGRLTKKMNVDMRYNAKQCARATNLWIERRGPSVPREQIATSPRIGVDYAGPIWSKEHYRFYWKEHVKK